MDISGQTIILHLTAISLKSSGRLYIVPPGLYEGVYGMFASVSSQTPLRKSYPDLIESQVNSHRWPILVSNDRMRDALQLIEPTLFRQWYACHVVNYDFNSCSAPRTGYGLKFSRADSDFFLREIQGNSCPHTLGGNRVGEGCWFGKAWHFPVKDWRSDERFLIRIPYHVKSTKEQHLR